LKFGFFWGKKWSKSDGEVSLWAKKGITCVGMGQIGEMGKKKAFKNV